MALNYPNIDPVLLHIAGPLAIRWYSLAYVLGIVLGVIYMKFLSNRARIHLNKKFIEDFITAIIIGILVGGRLGYVLLYDPGYYFHNLLLVFKIWDGGMAFHGGLAGFFISTAAVCRAHKRSLWQILDLAACAAPIGIFFGRIANFINGELFGRITYSTPWGMEFPNGGPFLRHPSQIYEALSEGVLLFIVMNIIFFGFKLYRTTGILCGFCLIFYSIFRIISENYREPDTQIGYIFQYFTMGQILSSLLLLFGLFIIAFAKKKKQIG